jgi:hypothetical protein
MVGEVELMTESGDPYRARVRLGTDDDRRRLITRWLPILMAGPAAWLDRDWPWEDFGAAELHIERNPEWVVLADELEPQGGGDILGVLVTTGPASTHEAGISQFVEEIDAGLLWLEYIAIAPFIRPACPARNSRRPSLKVVGRQLMRLAILRSEALGLDGRIGLHAEGAQAHETYTSKWNMRFVGSASHRSGDTYPVCYGDAAWAAWFRTNLRLVEGR